MCKYCKNAFSSSPQVIAEHIKNEHPGKEIRIITDECVSEQCGIKPSVKQMRGIAEVLRKHYER